MGRSPCSSKEGLNRGAWTVKEDMILTEYIRIHGDGEWTNLPQKAGLKRRGKSCRLRWLNYLRPDIKRGNISPDEEDLIIRMHRLIGNRWSLIAGRLPGRTDNEIKNYWNTHLKKKLRSMNESQTNSSTESFEKSSKSPPLLRKAETEIKFSTCSISDQQSSHSEHISGDATTLDKSSFYLKELSSPHWNQLLSPSYCSTYFGLEEFYMEPVTMAAESEDIFSDQSNMQLFNSFRVADYAGMEEFHDNAQYTDSISELNYF